jgi:hypothetical protein
MAKNTKSGRNTLMYAAVAILIIAIVVMAYFLFNLNAKRQATNKILSNKNLSNSSFNRTQLILLQDLQKSLSTYKNLNSSQTKGIHVTYYVENGTHYIQQSNGINLTVNGSETIDAYQLGSFNKTIIRNTLIYSNSKTGKLVSKNISSIYYYSSNTTITCFNDTTIISNHSNSSLQCTSGDAGLDYILKYPYMASNISQFGYLILEGNITYGGVKAILGRNCDSFEFSNVTHTTLLSNYSVTNLCLDSVYGIPIYARSIDIVNGTPISTYNYTATNFSTNVQGSSFIIPAAYLTNISK